MALSTENIADLVAALLCVNQYPLHRAVALVPALKAAGLLDPATVNALSQDALVAALRAAGYDRGGFVPILAFRMYPLMEALAAGQLDPLADAARSGDKAAFAATLGAVHGYGPRTIDLAWTLWTTV